MTAGLQICKVSLGVGMLLFGPVSDGREDMKILLIEDDEATIDHIVGGLLDHGHTVERATEGRSGLSLALGTAYDLLIVDRMLPGLDGLSLVKTIRSEGCRTPVLFLSTLGGLDDRVIGLNAGGDDYLVKPFAFSELLARVAALGRRPALVQVETVLRIADLEMDLLSRTVRRGTTVIDLLPREWQLLEYLMRNAGKVVTRTMLLERVWDFHFDPRTNVVETHISRLRQKVDKGFAVELIHTVRGTGYCLRAPE